MMLETCESDTGFKLLQGHSVLSAGPAVLSRVREAWGILHAFDRSTKVSSRACVGLWDNVFNTIFSTFLFPRDTGIKMQICYGFCIHILPAQQQVEVAVSCNPTVSPVTHWKLLGSDFHTGSQSNHLLTTTRQDNAQWCCCAESKEMCVWKEDNAEVKFRPIQTFVEISLKASETK
jgi:hypothetical protein